MQLHELHGNTLLVAIGWAKCMHSMDMVLSHAHAHCRVRSRGFAHLAALRSSFNDVALRDCQKLSLW